jgi:hypothetical protein
MSSPLTPKWIEAFGLDTRRKPDLYLSAEEVTGARHAGPMRVAFNELGLAAIFCVQDVPTVAFKIVDKYDRLEINNLHNALWNQGLASLLIVISENTVYAYSLAQLPQRGEQGADDSRLISEFEAIADAILLKNLVLGIESGRWWKENEDSFDGQKRVDQCLLDNMKASHDELVAQGLPSGNSQALLMQIMFLSYLEDRGVIEQEYISEACGANNLSTLLDVLQTGSASKIEALFSRLRRDFNGDLFVAPCAFDSSEPIPILKEQHISIITRFRDGRENMASGQLGFWAYNFRFIPVELISAVYDRFLGEDENTRRGDGAYYTPLHLADLVVKQAWDQLSEEQKVDGRILDPSCGSGIFLVRLFEQRVEHWRATNGQPPPWAALRGILDRLHGVDINASAVRIAAFSLYTALLDHEEPSRLKALMAKGRVLPSLVGKNLIIGDFFTDQSIEGDFDLIVGNPPWTGRQGKFSSAITWCGQNEIPIPEGDAAWGFSWKALRHLTGKGKVALLLPAMAFFMNHKESTLTARAKFLDNIRILSAINFADLRFQLFDGAIRPTALLIYSAKSEKEKTYSFDYWVPKADLNTNMGRTITLSSVDHVILRSDFVQKDLLSFKRNMWSRHPDRKLHQYLASLPRLSEFVCTYQELKRGQVSPETHTWVIGQGFQEAKEERLSDPKYPRTLSEPITQYPFLDTKAFQPIALPCIDTPPWRTQLVRRSGFSEGFPGPHILVAKGASSKGRVKASYTEQSHTFLHAIQSIKFPVNERRKAKLVAAILNSKLVAWFNFHETASMGAERPEIHQSQLLNMPFPSHEDCIDQAQARSTADKIVGIVDTATKNADELLCAPNKIETALNDIDQLVYDYFGLSDEEISIIDDTFRYIIPAMQPRSRNFPLLWKPCDSRQRHKYADTLISTLRDWFSDSSRIEASLVGQSEDLAILRLSLSDNAQENSYTEDDQNNFKQVLSRIWQHLPTPLSGNFQLLPDLRIFLDDDLYLVKPTKLRFWLHSAALADADAIASELHAASGRAEEMGQ